MHRRLRLLFLLLFLIACERVAPTSNEQTPESPPLQQPATTPSEDSGTGSASNEQPYQQPTQPISDPEVTAQALAANSYYLSDLRADSISNTYGPYERDFTNATEFGGDGRVFTINGTKYSKGFGTTSPSELLFDLGGVCSSFSVSVGIDDLWNTTRGKATFEIYADDSKLWDSGPMTHTDGAKASPALSMTNVKKLRLVTTTSDNGGQDDFTDWVDPILTCNSAPPALAPTDAGTKGYFGPVQDWPTIPTHAALLPNSSIIAWYARDTDGTTRDADYNDQAKHNSTIVDLWTLNTNRHSRYDNQTTDLFCAGFVPIADGRLLASGGNLGSRNGFYPGSVHTNFFDPKTKTWSRGPDMSEGRWYPSVLNLPNKEVLFIGGNSNETTHSNYIPDIWNPTTNTLRRLTNASTQARNFRHSYPWLHVAPNGQVFYSGSTTAMAYLDTTGTGSWSTTYTRDTQARNYGSSVLYEPGKILVMGGGGNTNTAVTINLTNGVQATPTAAMSYGRTHLNATLLADGTVFVNGGNTSGDVFDDTTSVYASEIWNPSTGKWTTAATAQKPRNYHAVSLLLPDATVWTAGGGGCGNCDENHQNAEIYYPSYLFKKDGSGLVASRPRIFSAPNNMTYNQSYTLNVPSAQNMTKVALVALGSVTHAFNMGQHYVPLTINSKSGSSLNITSPSDANIAPPGYYMLFVMNESGVPSIARMIQVK
ncbi:MAG: NPCBM/NEW2 domain-containing protein [Trueperaceae bacterium]